jgi:hypothetical protein
VREVKLMATAGLSDKVRLLVKEQYVGPALRIGSERLSISVRDILRDVEGDASARGRTPAICEVLQGKKLLKENGLEIEGVDGPPSKQSTTVVVHYRILPEALAAGRGMQVDAGKTSGELVETPKEKARRLTNSIRGLLKEELAAYGGGEAFMRWVRSDDDEVV